MNLLANTILDLTALIAILLLFASGKKNREQDFRQMLFDHLLLCMLCYLLVDLAAWYLDGKRFPGSYALQMALNSLIYLAQILCSFLWLLYTDYWVYGSRERIRARLLWYTLPMLVELALLIANGFTGWAFRISDAGLYVRGSRFLPCMLLFYSYAAWALFLSFRAFLSAKDRERRVYCLWMSGFMILPNAAMLFLAFGAYGISVTAPFYALSCLMVYLNVHQKRLIEEKQKVAQRDAELQRANVAIMLSQIQPHFLYNSLTAIYGLCDLNPVKAQEAVGMFSSYLRFNMDSLRHDRPVPFATELLHVKTYLALEQMRFDDMLRVVWEIQADDFMLPSLTVQPLVENAVRHGLGKRLTPGTVRISTREYGDRFTVTIADDGVGFDPLSQQDDGRSHIGIGNVRARLASLSRATLAIESEKGVGTTAVITIPKENIP